MSSKAMKVEIHKTKNAKEVKAVLEAIQCATHQEAVKFVRTTKAPLDYHGGIFSTCCDALSREAGQKALDFVKDNRHIRLEYLLVPEDDALVEYKGKTCKVIKTHHPFCESRVWVSGNPEGEELVIPWEELKVISNGSKSEEAEFFTP